CALPIYRLFISKKHFLEWTTAEEAEKSAKKDLLSYYKNMLPNVVLGILGLVLLFILPANISSIFVFLISILWLITPSVMYHISKEIKQKEKITELKEEDKQFLLEMGK